MRVVGPSEGTGETEKRRQRPDGGLTRGPHRRSRGAEEFQQRCQTSSIWRTEPIILETRMVSAPETAA